MTRGRHRQQLPTVKTVSGVTVGTVATAGVVLAVVSGDTQVLRLAVVASWLIALGLVAHSVRRGRNFNRELALQESMRRRDESLFSQQLTELSASIKGLQGQMATMHAESAELRAEIAQLRTEKAESDEIVRQARAERAKAQLAEREASDQRLLTAAAFEAAAAVLQSFGSDEGDSESGDWIDAWVASLRTSGELDLTMHDETIELDLEDEIVVGVVDELPIAKSA
jgi:regulator of replication initiation timing